MATKNNPKHLMMDSPELQTERVRYRQLLAMLPDPADLMLMEGIDLIEALGQLELISAEMTVSSARQLGLLQRLQNECDVADFPL